MAHVTKSSSAGIGGLTRHYERHKLDNGEYQKFRNQEIDTLRSHLNYNLATHQNLPQLDFINQRKNEVYCLNRKDVNLMCTWVITQPAGIIPAEQDHFFQKSYKFLEQRYGKENIISSYVHLDESTPHMHFAFIPVTFDKKKNIYKVSAKEVVNRTDLQKFHVDLDNYMKCTFKRDIGILNDSTKDGNKSIKELKNETINKNTAEAEKIINNAKIKRKILVDDIKAISVEYDTKKAYVKEYDKISEISNQYPDYAKIKKNLLGKPVSITVPIEKWEAKHISANEKSYLKKQYDKLEEKLYWFKQENTITIDDYNNSKMEIKRLKSKINMLDDKNKKLEKSILQKEKEKNILIDKFEKTLEETLPAIEKNEVIENFNKKLNLSDKVKSISIEL